MKKSLVMLALCVTSVLPMGLQAMENKQEDPMFAELKQKSQGVADNFFKMVRDNLAAGTLTNKGIRTALEQIAIKKEGHALFTRKALDTYLAGQDGDSLFKYLQTVHSKVKAGESLTTTEKEQAKAIYQLIMTLQDLPAVERLKREFSPVLGKALQ